MLPNGGRGFTLIEISVVLVIIGVLIAFTASGITPVLQSSKVSQTNQKLDRIELGLLAYVMQNGCLPCPADGTIGSAAVTGGGVLTNAGWSVSSATAYYGPNGPTNQPCAAPTGTGCLHTIGVVPWNTLALRDSDSVDPWQDRISYAVTSALTVTAGTSMTRALPASYPAGTLYVNNNSGTQQTSTAAYVLISHGSDRSAAYAALNGALIPDPYASANQAPNNGSTGTGGSAAPFRQDKPLPAQGAAYFDDIVRFRTAAAVIQNCGKNACGNPP